MTVDLRESWQRLRQDLHDAVQGTKDSQVAVLELSKHYGSLPENDKLVIDALLGEWVLSSDEDLRFDALALIDEHCVVSAIPALRRLAERLEVADRAAAVYEWTKVNRIVGRLTSECGNDD